METHYYWIWFVTELCVVACFTYFLLNKYSGKSKITNTVKALTFVGWFLGLATIAVLPIDIALTHQNGVSTTEDMTDIDTIAYRLRVFWRSFYWLAFFYSFILVPFVMHYEVSGEFDEKLRVKAAAMKVIWTYTRYVILGAIFVVFLWFQGAFNSSDFSLRGFLMAMGSAFGLLQIIVFLGYGLVNVPR